MEDGGWILGSMNESSSATDWSDDTLMGDTLLDRVNTDLLLVPRGLLPSVVLAPFRTDDILRAVSSGVTGGVEHGVMLKYMTSRCVI